MTKRTNHFLITRATEYNLTSYWNGLAVPKIESVYNFDGHHHFTIVIRAIINIEALNDIRNYKYHGKMITSKLAKLIWATIKSML